MRVIDKDTIIESTTLEIPELKGLIGRKVHVRISEMSETADAQVRFKPGSLKGVFTLSPKFDLPVDDFSEYM